MRRRRILPILLLAVLVWPAWSAIDFVLDRAPPHRFVVSADRQIQSAQLTLNDRTKEMQIDKKTAWGSMNLSDASGNITVRFVDGTTTDCLIGYVTNGEREPHRIRALGGSCIVPSSEV